MPTLSYDAQSLLLDGRRLWLVSGSIHYPRVPRQLWRDRIRAAKQAGLNCIETYVFWNLHEPRPGVFNFDGDADLRHFVQLIAAEGMFCILRPGPYVCSEWDFGGLPAWLHRVEGLRIREANPPFLEACARYFGAVMDQVRDLQVTVPTTNGGPGGLAAVAPGSNGPIVMIQAENEWFCYNPPQATGYLGELVHYLRQNGCEVPINVCNNLWQRVDGTIDTWNGNQHLSADLRQLRVVQPRAPRLMTEYWPGWFDQWGRAHHTENDADFNSYRLAQILAAGAQYNLYMFHGGTSFGFWGGRTVAAPDCFMTTSYDFDAPLLEAGGRGPKYLAVKRISTFASQFGGLFASLDPARQHAAVAPRDDAHALCVIYQAGSQGEVVFLLRGRDDKRTSADIMLPNGLTLPVPFGKDRVAWFLLNANLGGSGQLNYTNLRPLALVGRKLLVLFGPAGAEGLVSINNAALTVTVPDGPAPLVRQHEGITVAVLSGEQVDAAYTTASGLIVGAAGLDANDQPLPHRDFPTMHLVSLEGQVSTVPLRGRRLPTAPRLGKWAQAPLVDLVAGKAAAFGPVAGPISLEALGCDYGYGWYRLSLAKPPAGSKVLAPLGGDRLHVYSKGKLAGILGLGAGATSDPAALAAGGEVVVLADNLGRFNYGWLMGEKKGLFGHIHAVKPVKLPAPKVVAGRSPDPFLLGAYLTGLRVGETHPADALIWTVNAPAAAGGGKAPLILDIGGFPQRAMVFVNDRPVGLYDPNYTARIGRWVLEPGPDGLKPGKNELKLALFDRFAPAQGKDNPLHCVRLYESTALLSAKGEWAFARWTQPDAAAFAPLAKPDGQPCWFRTHFTVSAATVPLFLEPNGMSKGQIYLNGRDLGRYWVNSPAGKPVAPQRRYYLPEPWLKVGEPNELVLFDEHGESPAKCQLVYDPMGPYGK